MGNMLRNMLRILKTCWEIDENTLEQQNQKNPTHTSLPFSIGKEIGSIEWMLQFLIG